MKDPTQVPPYIRLKADGSLNLDDIEVIAWLRRVAKDRDTRIVFMKTIDAIFNKADDYDEWRNALGDKAFASSRHSSTIMEDYTREFECNKFKDPRSIPREDIIRSLFLNGGTTLRMTNLIAPLCGRYLGKEETNKVASTWLANKAKPRSKVSKGPKRPRLNPPESSAPTAPAASTSAAASSAAPMAKDKTAMVIEEDDDLLAPPAPIPGIDDLDKPPAGTDETMEVDYGPAE
jgi:hypothetical protein